MFNDSTSNQGVLKEIYSKPIRELWIIRTGLQGLRWCNSSQWLRLRAKKSNFQSQPLNRISEKKLKSENGKNFLWEKCGVN